jgi:hypothetical protein
MVSSQTGSTRAGNVKPMEHSRRNFSGRDSLAISSEDLEREDEMVRMHRVLRGTATRMGTCSSVFESAETAWKSGNIPNLSVVVWGQPMETVV